MVLYMMNGKLWWLSGRESTCNAGRVGSITGSGSSPGEGNGNPLQYSCLENPTDRGAWQAIVHWLTRVVHDLDLFSLLCLVFFFFFFHMNSWLFEKQHTVHSKCFNHLALNLSPSYCLDGDQSWKKANIHHQLST